MGRDRVSKEKRSEIMSKIKSKDTKPELQLKEILNSVTIPFGIPVFHPPAEFKPECIIAGKRTAIFVDGDFWHGKEKLPLRSGQFWINKIIRNMQRDEEANLHYVSNGWTVIRIWESAFKRWKPEILRAYFESILTPDTRTPGVRHIG